VSRLRGSDATNNIKLIMLSAVDLHGPYDEPTQPTEDAPKVERVLTKPIKATDLITHIKELVG
jgi:hypothetical protein